MLDRLQKVQGERVEYDKVIGINQGKHCLVF